MILYFSGTGNSKYVAERIATECEDTTCSILECSPKISLEPGEMLGIVTPVNWWELPILVREFLHKIILEAPDNPYVFLVATFGTTTGCIAEDARRILKKRGISLNASFCVQMPDTWTPLFDLSDPEEVAEQNRKAEPQIDHVISEIKNGTTGNHTHPRAPYLVRCFTDPLLNSERETRHFYVEDTCIGCGLCAKKCPVQAIEMQDKKPVWVKKSCALCLGCLHRCPSFAIQYGSGKTKLHGQYTNPNTNL